MFDDPTQPFTYAAALDAGMTARQLAGPEYRRVFPGVHVRTGGEDDLLLRARGAALLAPRGGVVSHQTAARFWGGLVPDDTEVHLAYRRDVRQSRVHGIRLHRFRSDIADVQRYGLRTTTPEQTFLHLTRDLTFLDLVALGDQLVKPGRWTSPALIRAFAETSEGQGRAMARSAAGFLREGVDSVPESKLRMLFVLGGLPEPVVNHVIWDGPDLLHRIELAFPEQRLAFEYDGRWHRTKEQVEHDRVRRAGLSEHRGWSFELVDSDDLFLTPDLTLHRCVRAMAEHGIAVPARVDDRWRQHFRVRHADRIA